ncbi:insulinase family protein [Myxococcus sp. 1LA]
MRDVAFPLRDFRFPSGLRVVVEQDARSPVVAVVAMVGAGGSSDPGGKEGLAHVVEHLAFRSRHAGGRRCGSAWRRPGRATTTPPPVWTTRPTRRWGPRRPCPCS